MQYRKTGDRQSLEGQLEEAEVSRTPPKQTPTHNDIRHGFVYERVPHITLKSIANNAEIDVIWEKWQQTLEPLRARLNAALGRVAPAASFETAAEPVLGPRGARTRGRLPQDEEDFHRGTNLPYAEEPAQRASRSTHRAWEEWEIPREAGADWPDEAKKLHTAWWQARIARQSAFAITYWGRNLFLALCG